MKESNEEWEGSVVRLKSCERGAREMKDVVDTRLLEWEGRKSAEGRGDEVGYVRRGTRSSGRR